MCPKKDDLVHFVSNNSPLTPSKLETTLISISAQSQFWDLPLPDLKMPSEEEIEKICPFCQGIFVQSKIKDHIEFAHSELIFKGNKNEAVDEDTKEALLSSEQRICPFCHDSFDRNEIKDHVGIAHLKPIILGNHDREDIKEPILTSLGLNPKVILKKLTPEELQGFNRNMAPNQTLENVEFSLENEMCKLPTWIRLYEGHQKNSSLL